MDRSLQKIIVIGGGAAGFFAAIAAKQASKESRVIIIEKHAALLSKVRISGGGRCNVTHACFEPQVLISNYPRGSKELLGPFYRFNPKNTLAWYESRNVPLKIEEDGRIFPKSDSSESIIQCLMNEVNQLGIQIRQSQKIHSIDKNDEGYEIQLENESLHADRLILATGSGPQGLKWAKQLGHTIIPPVPSLFTFNVPNSPLKELSGVAVKRAQVKVCGMKFSQTGPLLITHFGFSGPAILKISAWAAKELNEKKYTFSIAINWIPDLSLEEIKNQLQKEREVAPKKMLSSQNPFSLPKKLWKNMLLRAGEIGTKQLSQLSKKEIQSLSDLLHSDLFSVVGKTINKEEFVTCGGVELSEVNFKEMESKLSKNLYFAGEILNIDGITGGFNFQNAWTTGFIAGSSAALSCCI